MASEKLLKIDSRDNVLVALTTLPAGVSVLHEGVSYTPLQDIPAKHKMAIENLDLGAQVIMYGGVVARVREAIPRGGLLSTRNVQHDVTDFARRESAFSVGSPRRDALANAHVQWLPPGRRASWYAELLAGDPVRVLRKPQRRGAA